MPERLLRSAQLPHMGLIIHPADNCFCDHNPLSQLARSLPLACWPALLSACSPAPSSASHGERVSGGPAGTYMVAAGIHKIKHVVIVMQENRSFDPPTDSPSIPAYFAGLPACAGCTTVPPGTSPARLRG